MRIRTLISGSLALAAMLFAQSCGDKNEPEGLPEINLSKNVIEFQQEASSETIKVASTREWFLSNCPEWIAVDPKKGKDPNGMDVTISVLGNTGLDREAALKFFIGYDTKTLTVKQKGTGSATDLVVYHNDFDKTDAVKSEDGWKTYLDSFDGWKNETGSGLSSIDYAFNGMSARQTSSGASNGTYSDYPGSGKNYLWFAKENYFQVKNITLPENTVNYVLSFGSERNLYQAADNTFKHDEFLVYVSNDGQKWVALEYAFPNGDKSRRWDLASTTFTVPAGTKSLYVYMTASVASAYMVDDLDLSVAAEAGTVIDFSKGVDLGTGGGETPDPGTDYSKAESKTVAEFIAAADKATYYKLKGTVSGYNSTYCSFDLTDATGTIYVYNTANKGEWSSKIKDGGTVELAGLYDYYDGKSQHEVVKAQILSFTEGDTPDPSEIKDATVAEFIAAEVSTTQLYRLTGTITEIQNTTYGNLMLKDATGEVLIYGVKKDKDAGNTSFSELGAEVGDKLTVVGQRGAYNTTIEMKSGYCEKLEKDTTTPKFSVSTETLTAKAADKSVSFDVRGNVKWTVASDNAAYKVSPESGDGNGTVTVSFAENTTDKDVTVKLTVSTTAEVATKSYTVTLTHKGVSAAGTEDFSSSVEWTLGTNAYSDKATINGVEDVPVLKIGTSKNAGTATLKILAGTTKVSFYGVAWKGKTATIKASVGETQVATQALTANVGATSNSPYKLTVEDTDKYTITPPAKLEADTDVTVTTTTNARAILFAIRAE